MSALVVFPDWRSCLYQWVIDQPEVAALVDDRVFAELPRTKVYPLVRLSQISTPPVVDGARAAVRGLFQIDVWGGSQPLTNQIAETLAGLFETRLCGVHSTPAGDFVAGYATCGGIRRTTEAIEKAGVESGVETSAARPHCTFDLSVVLRPTSTGS